MDEHIAPLVSQSLEVSAILISPTNSFGGIVCGPHEEAKAFTYPFASDSALHN